MHTRVWWIIGFSHKNCTQIYTHKILHTIYTGLQRSLKITKEAPIRSPDVSISLVKVLLKVINFNPITSVIMLNMNSLNTTVKIQRFPYWLKKQDPIICHLKETHFKSQAINHLNEKGWKKLYHMYGKG